MMQHKELLPIYEKEELAEMNDGRYIGTAAA
jgi:hypothetical protein